MGLFYFIFSRAPQFSNVGAARVAASVDGISVSAASDEDGAAVRLDGRDVTAAAAAAGRPEPRRRRRRRAGKPAGLCAKSPKNVQCLTSYQNNGSFWHQKLNSKIKLVLI